MSSFFMSGHDDEQPQEKARRLLHSVLPDDLRIKMKRENAIQITGKRGIYILSPDRLTEIRDVSTGRRLGGSCLQLSIAAPAYDRMLAEYLILKNAEDFYWKTANIFDQSSVNLGVSLLAVLDFLLFVHLLLELI
jgi:hypothetical protein